ncbi:MAG: hypothetical protein ACOX3H_06720 [Saccharofermentanales bacterium]
MAKILERIFIHTMSISNRNINDKVTNSKRFNLSEVSRIVRSGFEYGYKDIWVRDIGNGFYEISKWNLGKE